MRVLRLITVLLASLVALAQTAGTAQSSTRKMALTFDDLPYVTSAGQPFLSNAQRVTQQLLAVLKQHRATAIGFVNEGKLQSGGELKLHVPQPAVLPWRQPADSRAISGRDSQGRSHYAPFDGSQKT